MRVTVADIKSGRERHVIHLLRLIYRLLKQFLLGSDEENQLHVATHFDTLAEQLDLKLGAADTLMQLISENRLIVQSIGEAQIQRFVRLLVQERDPSFVDFLVALCTCHGAAVHKHQLLIANFLFDRTGSFAAGTGGSLGPGMSSSNSTGSLTVTGSEQRRDSTPTGDDGAGNSSPSNMPFQHPGSGVLFPMRLVGDTIEVEMPSISFGHVWIPLYLLYARQSGDKESIWGQTAPSNRPIVSAPADSRDALVDYSTISRQSHAIFFLAVLRLYKALCAGQNTICSGVLTSELRIVSLDLCKCGIFDERLPMAVRAAFADLCRVIYLDKFAESPVIADYVYPLHAVKSPPTIAAMLESATLKTDVLDLAGFAPVADWIVDYLPQAAMEYYVYKTKDNSLILSALRLLRFLVSYGYYRDMDQINKLLDALVGILDGRRFQRREIQDAAGASGSESSEGGLSSLAGSRNGLRGFGSAFGGLNTLGFGLALGGRSNSNQHDGSKSTLTGNANNSYRNDDLLLSEQYVVSDMNQVIIKAKIEACSIVEMFLALRVELRVGVFLNLWVKNRYPRAFQDSPSARSPSTPSTPSTPTSTLSPLSSSVATAEPSQAASGEPDGDPFADTNALLSNLFATSHYFDLNEKLTGVLLDLLRHQSTGLRKSTLRLLHRLHSSTEELAAYLSSSLLICDERHLHIYSWIKHTKVRYLDPGSSFVLSGVDRHRAEYGPTERTLSSFNRSLKEISILCLADSQVVAAATTADGTAAASTASPWDNSYGTVKPPPWPLDRQAQQHCRQRTRLHP
ncbi:hypothetical protein BC831DRAFT_155407 [Entophlyctis helioformis]|nr:hypothetical protein BC831DRAFT_155407 [Entophlyctis helioformis]